MITIKTVVKNGIYPGEPDTDIQWILVTYNDTVIANLPLHDQPWTEIEGWAQKQIDLYLEQQIGQVNV